MENIKTEERFPNMSKTMLSAEILKLEAFRRGGKRETEKVADYAITMKKVALVHRQQQTFHLSATNEILKGKYKTGRCGWEKYSCKAGMREQHEKKRW